MRKLLSILLFIYNVEYIKYFLSSEYFIITITNISIKNTFHQNNKSYFQRQSKKSKYV